MKRIPDSGHASEDLFIGVFLFLHRDFWLE